MLAPIVELEAQSGNERRNGLRHENLARLSGGHDSCGLVYGHTSDDVTGGGHLPDVDAGSYLHAVTLPGNANRARAAKRVRRCVERRQQPISRYVDDATTEPLDLRPDALVEHCDLLTPRDVTDPDEHGRRFDDIGEQESHERAVLLANRAGERTHSHPLDHDRRFVADCEPVVTGRNVVDVVGAELEGGAVAKNETDATRSHDAHVPRFAPLAADEGLHVGRPAPARLLNRSRNGHACDLDQILDDARKSNRLVGTAEVFRRGRHIVTMTART